ncbi:MAG: hypothetical protein KatS3mg011_0652 [Acidimicrobiia bacterium]|nr:MAG: hypothetical protein KatS3mg011_0652 [Acidimicrobiia bacterium]
MPADLLVVGGSPSGLSVAFEAERAGVESVLVVVPTETGLLIPTRRMPRHRFGIIQTGPLRLAGPRPGGVVVETDTDSFGAKACVVDLTGRPAGGEVPLPVAPSVADRVHTRVDFDGADQDVLVVGGGEAAVVTTVGLVEGKARVVLCFRGRSEELSLVSRQLLEQLEVGQEATILWRSAPDEIVDVGGYPMALFGDRRTPDLQFDHVVFVDDGAEAPVERLERGPGVFVIGGSDGLRPSEAWPTIRREAFAHLPAVEVRAPVEVTAERVHELRAQYYNATITSFDTAHNELWRIRIRPDRLGVAHRAGQYCTLGLGYWEPRADEAVDPDIERKWDKLIRRSYSISSPIFDARGYLVDHSEMDEIELYIVWVRADADKVPALTPRLAAKQAGDRIYLGPKVAGRYTLDPVDDPYAPVLFCATGTGEAPHNAMIVELLRKGHAGPIVSAVSVRYWTDLAYLDEHRRLERRFPNYRYLPRPTREPDIPKRYLQDLLVDGTLEEALGGELDPSRTHVFLCGNPAMIGLPSWEGDQPTFPEPVGMAQLLHQRGFTLDRRGVVGNVHYEEYW